MGRWSSRRPLEVAGLAGADAGVAEVLVEDVDGGGGGA